MRIFDCLLKFIGHLHKMTTPQAESPTPLLIAPPTITPVESLRSQNPSVMAKFFLVDSYLLQQCGRVHEAITFLLQEDGQNITCGLVVKWILPWNTTGRTNSPSPSPSSSSTELSMLHDPCAAADIVHTFAPGSNAHWWGEVMHGYAEILQLNIEVGEER